MGSEPATLAGDDPPTDIAAFARRHADRLDISRNALEATKDREFVCEDCGRRCTRGASGVEYGHRRGSSTRGSRGDRCPRRSDRVEPSSHQRTTVDDAVADGGER